MSYSWTKLVFSIGQVILTFILSILNTSHIVKKLVALNNCIAVVDVYYLILTMHLISILTLFWIWMIADTYRNFTSLEINLIPERLYYNTCVRLKVRPKLNPPGTSINPTFVNLFQLILLEISHSSPWFSRMRIIL